MTPIVLHLSSACYGGLACTDHLRALLALRRSCAEQGVDLVLEVGGGEALASRGRAIALAKFLASEATHLVLTDGAAGFDPQEVLRAARNGPAVGPEAGPFLLIARSAAEAVSVAYADTAARVGDMRGAGVAKAPMVFDSIIEPETGAYLTDFDAFRARWRRLNSAEGPGNEARVQD